VHTFPTKPSVLHPASVVHDTSDLHVQHKGHVYLVNVFTPKPGQTEKFITAQTAEYRRLEGKIPGWLGNRLHRSIDGKKVVNYAEFESLGLYIKWRNSQLFKEHLDRVKDYVARAEPGMYSEPLYDMKSEINIGEEKMNSNKNDAPESPLVTEEIVEGVEQNLVIKNGDKTVRFKEGAASDGTGATEVEVEVTSTST